MIINDLDREQIAEQIIQGCNEGILDDSNGDSTHWVLDANKFKNN